VHGRERVGPHEDGDPDAVGDGELAAVEVEITDAFDLHTFAPRDIPAVVRAYLEAARERGLREVRMIHGKGKGVQRARVHQILSESPHVLDFREGSAERGGWGATLVLLRGPQDP
jgi:DNA-nicking Smr family endonuclease